MPVLDDESGAMRGARSRAGAGCAIAAVLALLLCVGVPLTHPVSFSLGRNGIYVGLHSANEECVLPSSRYRLVPSVGPRDNKRFSKRFIPGDGGCHSFFVRSSGHYFAFVVW